jgi:hypothetical protein
MIKNYINYLLEKDTDLEKALSKIPLNQNNKEIILKIYKNKLNIENEVQEFLNKSSNLFNDKIDESFIKYMLENSVEENLVF